MTITGHFAVQRITKSRLLAIQSETYPGYGFRWTITPKIYTNLRHFHVPHPPPLKLPQINRRQVIDQQQSPTSKQTFPPRYGLHLRQF